MEKREKMAMARETLKQLEEEAKREMARKTLKAKEANAKEGADPILNEYEVVELLGGRYAVNTLRQHRFYRIGIPFLKIGGRVGYRYSEVKGHLDAGVVEMRSTR